MIYKAMAADGFGIVSVVAYDAEIAHARITEELSKPGRDGYLKDWQDGGELMQVRGGLLLEERISDQLDHGTIGLLAKALAGGRKVDSLQESLAFVLTQRHPDVVNYSLPATFVYYCDTCEDVMQVEAARRGDVIYCSICGGLVRNAEHVRVGRIVKDRVVLQKDCAHCEREAKIEAWAVLRLASHERCTDSTRLHCGRPQCEEKVAWHIERELAGRDIVLHR